MRLGDLKRCFLLVLIVLSGCESNAGRPEVEQLGQLPEGMEIVATARSTNPAGADETDELYALISGGDIEGIVESLKNEGFVEAPTPGATWMDFRGLHDHLEAFVGPFGGYKQSRGGSPLTQDILEDLEDQTPRGVNAGHLVLVLLVELP